VTEYGLGSNDEQEILYFWHYMRQETCYDWCWACGKGERDKPSDWHAPWFPHRAHIVHNPRKKDRRAVILLCPLCHGTEHGNKYPGHDLPKLTVDNMLWLKESYDGEFYDRDFCEQNTIGILPLPEPLPTRYNTAYEKRRGRRPQSYIKGENG